MYCLAVIPIFKWALENKNKPVLAAGCSDFRTRSFLLISEAGKNDTIARFSWAILRSSATCGDEGATHEKRRCCCIWNGFAGWLVRVFGSFGGGARSYLGW